MSLVKFALFVCLGVAPMGLVPAEANDTEDPHFDFADFSTEEENFDEPGYETQTTSVAQDSGPLVIPAPPQRPPVPLLFAAAADRFNAWKKAGELPEPSPATVSPRNLASETGKSETENLTQIALRKEDTFQDQVVEASFGSTAPTYQSIVRAISSGKVTPTKILGTTK